MKVLIDSLSSVQKKITFEIPPERVSEEMEKAFRTFQPNARLKGFRAGKVPRNLLERHFGEQVAAEVSAQLVEESYAQAVQEHALPVVSRPRVVAEKLTQGQPFRYSATVDVRPEVTIGNYEALEVEKKIRTIKEEEIDKAMSQLAESFAQLRPVTDRDQVQQGDVVSIDYAASVDGRPLRDLQGKGRTIEIGKEAIFPGLQEHLIGVRKGETLQFSLPLPESAEVPEGTERVAAFRVTVQDIALKELPPLDDEFAKDHGECDTLAELREKVRQNMQQAADRRAESGMQEALLSRLIEVNPFEVPPSMVHDQLHRLLMDIGLHRPGADFEQTEAALPEQIRKDLETRAQKQVQTVFLLDALAKQNSLSVTDEEVQKQIEEVIAAVGVDKKAQVEAYYSAEENRFSVRQRLLQEKALRFATEKANIRTVHETDVAGGEEKE